MFIRVYIPPNIHHYEKIEAKLLQYFGIEKLRERTQIFPTTYPYHKASIVFKSIKDGEEALEQHKMKANMIFYHDEV